jgi:asparagine synthase (glutamine-hydrolysing)
MSLSQKNYKQVFEFDLSNFKFIEKSLIFRKFIFLENDIVKITGDQSGERKLYVFFYKKYVLLSFNFINLLNKLNRYRNMKFPLNENSIKELLSIGLISSPNTFLKNLYVLVIGDILILKQNDNEWSLKKNIQFPYFNNLNKKTSIPSTKKLKELISNSLSKRVKNPHRTILMLSSGKDSSALAVGLAEANLREVKCITFSTEDRNDEATAASNIASKLGLKHDVVTLETNKKNIKDNFLNFFQNMDYPCIDNAIIPYVLCLSKSNKEYNTIIDGMGNDIYFGHVPSKKAIFKMHFHCNIYKYIFKIMEPLISRTSNLSYLQRYKSQLVVPGKYFKLSELKDIYSDICPDLSEWKNIDQIYKKYDVFDFRAVTRGRYYDQNVAMLKAECVSGLNNSQTIFPWCDTNLIDYVFNLPEEYKFDRKELRNKILLRMFLEEEIQYSSIQTKKVGFYLNSSKFVSDNETYIKDEIFSCKLWREPVRKLMDHDFCKLNQNYKISYSIILLFLLSGWVNHSKYFRSYF